MLAQAFAEYGALTSLISAGEQLAYSVSLWFRNAGPETWLAIGGGVMVLLWLLGRRG